MIDEAFAKFAREYFPVEVPISHEKWEKAVNHIGLVFGYDPFPKRTGNRPPPPHARWTISPNEGDEEDYIVFFKTEIDAIEFKLRFG